MVVRRDWKREAVVYQVYPRSFNDADGDGVGDLRGVIERLDYFEELGVDVVWLNPVYDSPLADGGYDVRDYRAILDEYGDMADWEALRDGLHERGIRLIMDLVVNHTSDEHEWFRRSRSRKSPYEDYYIWRPGGPDEPPNNWESFFDGPAWTYDEERDEWYLHLFDDKQPDLNWQNPAVRGDVYEMMRWWLDRGVDGFRMDVINLLSKRDGLPDGDPDSGRPGSEHVVNGPRIHEYIREMYDRVLADYDAMSVGETVELAPEEAARFVDDGLDMVLPFEHVTIDVGEGTWDVRDWSIEDVRDVVRRWQREVGDGWIGLYLENHDQPRAVSRFGDESYRYESATMLATFLFTLRGTPFVYQGEEIGMTNANFERLDEYRDVATIQRVELALQTGDLEAFEHVREAVNYWSRDNARTPMQWSDERNAGFTDGEPWIKVNRNYPEVNVAAERERERSVLRYYRRLVDLRREHPVLVYGEYRQVLEGHPELFAYRRALDDERILVVVNTSDREPALDPADLVDCDGLTWLLGNYGPPDEGEVAATRLLPDDGTGAAVEADEVNDAAVDVDGADGVAAEVDEVYGATAEVDDWEDATTGVDGADGAHFLPYEARVYRLH